MLETRGQHYSATRQPDKALADYTRLIELYPQMARGYYDRARHHLNFDQLGLAEADIAKSLELQRDYSKALELSVSVKFFQKKYQQVIKDADGLLAGETEAPAHLLLYRGYSLREMGRPEEAFESFWSAAKMLPFVASDMKSRMLARGYYSGSEEDSVEDNKFINGLKACAVDPGC